MWNYYYLRIGLNSGTETVAQHANPLLCCTSIPYGAGLFFSCSTSDGALCLWTGKTADDSPSLWDPATLRKPRESS